ncbi:MAG: alpha/beta hydrolase [Ornithinimicrobium sp.]
MSALPPEVTDVLQRMKASSVPVSDLSPAQIRASDLGVLALQKDPINLHSVVDVSIPGPASLIPARVYRPRPGPLQVMVFYPGGGFVIGPETYEAPLRALAQAADVVIVAPAYRLAPEHPYPAAVEDALAVINWVRRSASALGASSTSPAIAGDSSGGNLAAGVTHHLAGEGTPPPFQVLIYPMLDATASSPTYQEFSTGYGFTTAKAQWYFDQYLPSGIDRSDPRVSPSFHRPLSHVPRTLVAVAECDPLHGDGELYAEALEQAGVPVDYACYEGMIHGFFQMTGAISASRRLHADLADWIRAAVADLP